MGRKNSRQGRGFVFGILTGTVLAAVVALGLMLVFPSFVYAPPELEEAALLAPAVPVIPDGAQQPSVPVPDERRTLLRSTQGPLLEGVGPDRDQKLRAEVISPAVTSVLGPDGSPSLFPPSVRQFPHLP